MMKLVAFGASASKNSINKKFAAYTSQQFKEYETEVLDLNHYPLPLFTVDIEKKQGIPENTILFYNKIREADLLVISLAEHNGTYTAAFKNMFDWLSRFKAQLFENKNLVLISTSPGARGGKGVMDAALNRFPRHGARIIGHFCLPGFNENFDPKKGIINEELLSRFTTFIQDCHLELG